MLPYGTCRRPRGKPSPATDPAREGGSHAVSPELMMRRAALAVICLHITALAMCWGEISFHCLVRAHVQSGFITGLLALLLERVFVPVITVFSLSPFPQIPVTILLKSLEVNFGCL